MYVCVVIHIPYALILEVEACWCDARDLNPLGPKPCGSLSSARVEPRHSIKMTVKDNDVFHSCEPLFLMFLGKS